VHVLTKLFDAALRHGHVDLAFSVLDLCGEVGPHGVHGWPTVFVEVDLDDTALVRLIQACTASAQGIRGFAVAQYLPQLKRPPSKSMYEALLVASGGHAIELISQLDAHRVMPLDEYGTSLLLALCSERRSFVAGEYYLARISWYGVQLSESLQHWWWSQQAGCAAEPAASSHPDGSIGPVELQSLTLLCSPTPATRMRHQGEVVLQLSSSDAGSDDDDASPVSVTDPWARAATGTKVLSSSFAMETAKTDSWSSLLTPYPPGLGFPPGPLLAPSESESLSAADELVELGAALARLADEDSLGIEPGPAWWWSEA